MIRLFGSLLLLIVLFAPAVARAEVRTGAFTLTPMLGYQGFDSKLDLDGGMAYGLALGYAASKHWALEFDVRFVPTETDDAAESTVDAWTFTGNVLYHFMPENAFVPYLVAGLGGLQYDTEGDGHNDEDFIVNWGGGLKYALGRDVDLRLDLRHTIDIRSNNDGTIDDGTANNVAAMLGLNFQLGGVSQAPVRASRTTKSAAIPIPAPVAAVAPVATPAAPAPAAALLPPVAPPIVWEVPAHDDRDGVPDRDDRCPETPPGTRVDSTGCPADTDRDGVADYLDACVDTLPGARVDARGCQQVVRGGDVLPLKIQFGAGKSEVTPFHYRELDRAAAFIRQHPQALFLVEVPIDDKGAAQPRAESLRRVLIARYGLPAERIVARGDGLGGQGVVVSVIP